MPLGECSKKNKRGGTYSFNYLSPLFNLIPAGILAEEPLYIWYKKMSIVLYFKRPGFMQFQLCLKPFYR